MQLLLLQVVLNFFEVDGRAGTATPFGTAAAFGAEAPVQQARHVACRCYKNDED